MLNLVENRSRPRLRRREAWFSCSSEIVCLLCAGFLGPQLTWFNLEYVPPCKWPNSLTRAPRFLACIFACMQVATHNNQLQTSDEWEFANFITRKSSLEKKQQQQQNRCFVLIWFIRINRAIMANCNCIGSRILHFALIWACKNAKFKFVDRKNNMLIQKTCLGWVQVCIENLAFAVVFIFMMSSAAASQ